MIQAPETTEPNWEIIALNFTIEKLRDRLAEVETEPPVRWNGHAWETVE